MSNVVMCRVCLVADVRMHVIINTPFQDIFTKFTDITISPEDGKPGLLCYICHTLLRKCFKFYNKALQADKLLTLVIQGGVVKAESVPVLNTHTHKQLCVSPIEVISYKDPPETVGIIEVPVKEEVPIKREVKQERCEEHSDIDDNIWQSDSDDNIPLKNFSLKKSEKVKVRLKREERGRITEFAREIILTKEQQLQELVDRSKSVNYINSPLKCELCFKGFIDVNAYDNHRDKHDEKSGAHECDVCHMRYKTQRQLRTHCATSHSRQYACVKCTHRSHTANQAREHEQWHDGYTYECKLCGQKFRKHTSYLTHKRKRHPTQHVCPICGHSFVGRHGLLMHQSKAHRLIDKQPEVTEPASDRHCSRCGIQFVTRHAWQRHVLSASARQGCCDNSLTCRICDVTFSSRVALLSHFKEHERSLRTSKTSMPRAVAVPLACDQCGANFVNRSKLQAHVKRIHLGVKYNKNIVCEVCGKKCTSNASLKYHQRTHTGEKPYQCSTCPKRFADKNQLRIHTRTHTGERPYCCTVCGKRFSQKPALNRHYRVHTGDKPYVCQFCSKTFTQSNSLKLHVRTVHLKMTSKRKAPAAIDKVEDTAVQAL